MWCGLYLIGGWQCIYQTIKRGDMRQRLGIEGSGVTDWLASWCCPCCGLVQEEKESLLKQEAINAQATQYNAPTGMAYP
jgi:Cys-rich protein (TIGR01571 family)